MKLLSLRRIAAAATATLAIGFPCGPAEAATATNSQPSARMCLHEGWQALYRTNGSAFSSARDCVGYRAQGGILWTHPYGVTQAVCMWLGGAFEVGTDGGLWSCNGWPYNADAESLLVKRCGVDGGDIMLIAYHPGGLSSAGCSALEV